MQGVLSHLVGIVGGLIALAILLVLVLPSVHNIGPTEVGLVRKRFGKKLPGDNPIAFKGEAGYQADLLMPGFRWKFWLLYSVSKHPWVQVPAGQIGVVIAQIGEPLPVGAKSAAYKNVFGRFSNVRVFVENGGQKGVQRPVLEPGSALPIHPMGFLVITAHTVYGVPVSDEFYVSKRGGDLNCQSFGLRPEQLMVQRIEPTRSGEDGRSLDMVGIVTTLEGDPLPSGDIASRIGGFADIAKAEADPNNTNIDLIELVLGTSNGRHNNYQDFQAFLDAGGKIGLQHDPLLYGAYNLNPFLVRLEMVPMLVVEQGEVAVVKAYVGLPTEDTSGDTFKFGSLVKPGHRGIWNEPLRTGKYPVNPHCYQWEKVPTAILTLNWAEAVSKAHDLDAGLQQIDAKSCEGFEFKIDLQVQIHVPDTRAPRVISMVGTMYNLVNEVLQAAVGNHFRDRLQAMTAVKFIQERQAVQTQACEHIRTCLNLYEVETPGVYIQDVVLPPTLVKVLSDRAIADQEIETFKRQQAAQAERIAAEKSKGMADQQSALAQSEVKIMIKTNEATARKAEAEGEATYITQTGQAKGAEVRAVGMAQAEAYQAQVHALGQGNTAMVNVFKALAAGTVPFAPKVLVMGGNGGGALEALAATLTNNLVDGGSRRVPRTEAPAEVPAPSTAIKDEAAA